MGIRSRIENTIDEATTGWRAKWGPPLLDWLISWISGAITGWMEEIEPHAIDNMRAVLDKIKDNPATPQDLKDIIDRVEAGGHPFPLLIVIPLAIISLLPSLLGLAQPAARLLSYEEDKLLHSARVDPDTITRAWLRDKAGYEWLYQDLRDLGWSEDKIDVVKELSKIIPPLADMVRFADFSAFDPDVIAKWRQFYDAPGWITEPFELLGITNETPRDWANKYWFSHYVQPGRFELGEMYRRGLLGTPLVGSEEIGGTGGEGEAEETIKLAYRTMAYSEFWQDRLLQLVREVPTRVDVRRWWDLRTIDEAELRSIYQRLGYFGRDLENYVTWTKVYVAFPDMISRWQKGWITLDDIRTELANMGMPAVRIEELIQTKLRNVEAERVATERDLTKTDIYKGVKTERITRDQGVDLLIDLGYEEDEAIYLLDVNIPTEEVDSTVKQRELTKADLYAALKEEVISEAEVRDRLLDLRYTPVDADLLLDIWRTRLAPEEITEQRELTKSDITRGLSTGILSPEETKVMLTGIGYTSTDADYLIELNTPAPEVVETEKARQITKTDIKTAYLAGILTMSQAVNQLEALGYTTEDSTFLVTLYDTVESIKKTIKPKEASKADITLAVKKGLITAEEGYNMLTELGFSPEASAFILQVRAETSPFSPTSYEEFKKRTEQWRAAAGRGITYESERLREFAAVVVEAQGNVESLEAKVKEEEAKIADMEAVTEIPKELKRARLALNRARAALQKAKDDYDKEVATVRQGLM